MTNYYFKPNLFNTYLWIMSLIFGTAPKNGNVERYFSFLQQRLYVFLLIYVITYVGEAGASIECVIEISPIEHRKRR